METETIYKFKDLQDWEYSGTSLAVVGKPISHSLSPVMHNAVLSNFRKKYTEFNDWSYFRFEIDPSDFPEAINLFYTKNFYGLNLTVPHKVIAFDLLDIVSESARAIGAVNTLVWTKDGYKGFNTDGYGIRMGIEYSLGLKLKNTHILIVGAGGAARSAVVECLLQGASLVYILNRSRDRLDSLCRSLSHLENAERIIPLCGEQGNYFKDLPQDGICINATSLGMNKEDAMPINLDSLPSNWALYDMVYEPEKTKLYKSAQSQSRNAATGLGMLVFQGAQAMELWSNRSVPVSCMFEANLKNR